MKRQPQRHYTRAASASRHAAGTTRDDSGHVLRVYNFAVSYPARSDPANCGENKDQRYATVATTLAVPFPV